MRIRYDLKHLIVGLAIIAFMIVSYQVLSSQVIELRNSMQQPITGGTIKILERQYTFGRLKPGHRISFRMWPSRTTSALVEAKTVSGERITKEVYITCSFPGYRSKVDLK